MCAARITYELGGEVGAGLCPVAKREYPSKKASEIRSM
jgi:hypothetical protein